MPNDQDFPRRFAVRRVSTCQAVIAVGSDRARLQCRVLWATSSIRISRVMRSCGMEKPAARPAIISDADSIESAISSPQAVPSGDGVASLCNLT